MTGFISDTPNESAAGLKGGPAACAPDRGGGHTGCAYSEILADILSARLGAAAMRRRGIVFFPPARTGAAHVVQFRPIRVQALLQQLAPKLSDEGIARNPECHAQCRGCGSRMRS